MTAEQLEDLKKFLAELLAPVVEIANLSIAEFKRLDAARAALEGEPGKVEDEDAPT